MVSVGASVYEHHEDLIGMLCERSRARTHELTKGQRPTAEQLPPVVLGALKFVEELAEEANALNPRKPGCREGCARCCYQNIDVRTSELVALVLTIPEEEHARLRERAARTVERTGNGGPGVRAAKSIPCPFLEGTRCGVYAHRPEACRTHFSLSRSACDREWNRRHVSMRRDRTEPGVPMPTAPKAAGMGVMMGLDTALHEVGLELEVVELAAGLLAALEPGAISRWLQGDRIFRSVARSGNGPPYSALLSMKAQTPP